MFTPRSLATENGETVLSNKDKEIWGSLLISCAEPTTNNFVFSGFMSTEFFARHLLMSLRSWFTAAIALADESNTENVKCNWLSSAYAAGCSWVITQIKSLDKCK